MAQLSSFRFTNVAKGGEVATAGTTAWQNTAVAPIQAQAGDDVIQSFFGVELGALTGTPTYGPNSAYYSVLPTVAANLYTVGVANGGNGTIDMGAGRDILSGTIGSGARSISILNGKIGGGGATPTGEKLVMGVGDDEIHGINNSPSGANSYGIYNTGTIDLGTGNDIIQGIKTSTSNSGAAIFNSGSIIGGAGDDEFDALIGGWAGSGKVDGGAGADSVMGFGSGTFDGGAGLKDELILGAGTYALEYKAIPTATTASFRLTRAGDAGVVMNVINFEAIGSIDPLAGIHPQALDGLRPSAFTIDELGAFTSVTFVSAKAPVVA
jgi:hypothetical protein